MNDGLQSGDIDLGKLMATTNKMVNNLCEELSENDEEGMGEMGAMISNMTGMLKNLQTKMNSPEVQERLPKKQKVEETPSIEGGENTTEEIKQIKEDTVNSF